MERNLSDRDIQSINNDNNNWDGVERRKGNSMIPEEMEKRKNIKEK